MSIAGDLTVGSTALNKNLTVSGTLAVSYFFAPKPWVGFLVTTDGAGVATISKHVGYNTTGVSVAHSTNGLYTFTIPAHPSGANYLLMLSPYSTSTSVASMWPTGYSATATAFYAYVRSTIGATTNINGSFYVYTVP